MKNIRSGICMILLLVAFVAFGQNPVIPDVGMSDPHIRVYDDTIYLYCGHDSHPNDSIWIMKEWRVFSTTDLHNWKLEGNISPRDNYMDDKSTDCWAGDGATRNGKYYFYFSDRKRGIGVMGSDNPGGPFRDALGKPLVSPLHDPTILVDDDPGQTPYIIYGDKSDSYYIARLNENMISLAEPPKAVEIRGDEWEKAPMWMDKNYLFKHNDTYYLSWGRDYATSKSVYGPYTCVGAVGQGHHLNEFAHGSFFWWRGQFYHIWCYYIREGYKYRETVISYCHFDDDGGLVTDTDFLDTHFRTGVCQYEASWPLIEAEWYSEISPGIEKKGNRKDGFVLSGIKDGAWLKFDNVNFGGQDWIFRAGASLGGGEGWLELRSDSLSGPLLGRIDLQSSGDGGEFLSGSSEILKLMEKQDLIILFRGDQNAELKMDWFKFIPDPGLVGCIPAPFLPIQVYGRGRTV